MTRQTKTPAQRAQEAYDVAVRIAARLYAKACDLEAQLDEVQAEHRAAVARRDYLAGHPDLPQQTLTTKENHA